MLPLEVERATAAYLRFADRFAPGRVVGFYVVGSTALGAYRPDRSDIDFVAVVDGDLSAKEMRGLRLTHLASSARTLGTAVTRGRLGLNIPGGCNGSFVRSEDLALPVSKIVPVASHVAERFSVGSGFDVNPVMWHTFTSHGIAVRGHDAASLGLDPEPERLREWNLANLHGYWARVAAATAKRPRSRSLLAPRWLTAWCVLGPPRLHRTINHGDVITKEAAGEYALETFDREWHPLINEALAYWRSERSDRSMSRRTRRLDASAFVRMVIDSVEAPAAG